MVGSGLTAIALVFMSYLVNGLYAGSETTVLARRRDLLMQLLLAGALAQVMAMAVACLLPQAPALSAVLQVVAGLALVAVPVLFWPVVERIRTGQLHVVNKRLLARARRAENEARGAAAWLALAEQAGHVGHWQLSVPGNELRWSDEMFRIHGLWREHFSPRLETALAVFHPLDGKRIGALLQEICQHGGTLEAAARLRRPDGEVRHVILQARAFENEVGQVTRLDGVMVDVTEPKRAEAKPSQHITGEVVSEDALTGLVDRKQLDQCLGYEFKRAVRSRKPLGLVLVEIDHFYQYRLHYGQREADICLRTVAQAVQALPRRTGDVVARFGDTEIAVLLPLADAAGALRVAGQIADAIRGMGLVDAGRDGGLLTVSCGAASMGMDDLYNPMELTRRAMRALGDARLFGGDRVCGFREVEFTGAVAPRV